MTKEQVEEIRRVAARHCRVAGFCGLDAAAPMTAAQALRLLDEREALLEALRRAADSLLHAHSILNHAWAQERPPDREAADEGSEAEDAAREAIKKAEAP